jgi:hypothetical protein
MWKTMVDTGSSLSPVNENEEEPKANIDNDEQRLPLRHRNKTQLILAHKLRNLQDFANGYNLNLSNPNDTSLKTANARENVQRMANDILASIDETNQTNLGSFVAQMGGNNRRSLAQSRIQTFYQELLDVMPSAWKEIFEQSQKESV